jgi:glyoxylase-like metal-dependent hydrolase (beta-lactamase superfamily II)
MLDTPLPNLKASPPEALPFAPSLHIRAFKLERDQGNLLIYAAPAATDVGDVTAQYLNHWHEAGFVGEVHAPVVVNDADRDRTEETLAVDRSFSGRVRIDDDFEAIPIPGHTPGATAFLWNSGEQRLLFTGDSVYLHDGNWIAAVLGDSDRAAYIESLERLRELEFDVLVPWAASANAPFYALTDPADARSRIDAIIERLRRGEDN